MDSTQFQQPQAYYIAQSAGQPSVATLQYPQQQNAGPVVAYSNPSQPQGYTIAQPQAQPQAYTVAQPQAQAYSVAQPQAQGQPQIVYATNTASQQPQILAVQPQGLVVAQPQQTHSGVFDGNPPDWVKEKSEVGPFRASPLIWGALALLFTALVLHIVAMAVPNWTNYTSFGAPLWLGVFNRCSMAGCAALTSGLLNVANTGVDLLKTVQATVSLTLISMVIVLVIYFVFMSLRTNTRKILQIVIIIGSLIAFVLMVVSVSVYEAAFRRQIADSIIGPALIVEIVALCVQLLAAIVLIVHYALVTSKL